MLPEDLQKIRTMQKLIKGDVTQMRKKADDLMYAFGFLFYRIRSCEVF